MTEWGGEITEISIEDLKKKFADTEMMAKRSGGSRPSSTTNKESLQRR